MASSRLNSEDRLALHRVDGDGLVIVVADGAGGISGGAAAADAVLESVETQVRRGVRESTDWVGLLQKLDGEIQQSRGAGETTAIVLFATSGFLVGAIAGDSDVVIVRADGAIDDHLSEHQRPHRKRRLGSGRANPTSIPLSPWLGTLVVATDGLWSYAPHDRVSQTILSARAETAANDLVRLVRLPSGKLNDDVAVAVVHNVG